MPTTRGRIATLLLLALALVGVSGAADARAAPAFYELVARHYRDASNAPLRHPIEPKGETVGRSNPRSLALRHPSLMTQRCRFST
jgi:hypothetical protein